MSQLIPPLFPLSLGLLCVFQIGSLNAETRAADLCSVSAIEAERLLKLPPYILQAIALTESGKWDADDKRRKPWPWAVGAQGKSWYFSSKKQAVDHVRGMQKKNISNIDVGCMQINLRYHGKAFNSLEEAFSPVNNVAYSGIFLSELYSLKNSWNEAVKYYHSATPKYNRKYIRLVFNNWQQLRKQAVDRPNDKPQVGVIEAEPATVEEITTKKPEESQNEFLPENQENRETQSILSAQDDNKNFSENLFRYDAFARVQAAQLFQRRFEVNVDTIPPPAIPERP